MTRAYRLWSVDKIDRAIEIGERGMRLAMTNKNNDPEILSKFQNSLAYYYADAQKTDREKLAREYAEAAYKTRKDSGPADTYAYVLITFGNPSAIQRDVSLSHTPIPHGPPSQSSLN